MKIYNTLTRKKTDLVPIKAGAVNIFVCGPTVYDYSHLGHAKTYTQFDLIVRYLRSKGLKVNYLVNITDIDDKIIARAKEANLAWDKLAADFEELYYDDMKALHNTAVTKYARATDYIPQIVQQVKTLMDKGFAYKISDGIYFEVSRFKDYGKLSGRTEVKAEDAQTRIDESPEKRGWNDFCLWKFSKPDEPSWDTELGSGRPGWHIEDTAITETEFGPQYDIHGGAVDLIFPHHEAEITQMEAASGKSPLAKYWLHTGFLNFESQKMSKSLGNFTTIRQALEQQPYRVWRYLFASSHYRSALDFSPDSLEQSKNSLKRLDEFLFNIDRNFDDQKDQDALDELTAAVQQALDDDFNTPEAFAAIFDFVRTQNASGQPGRRVYKYFEQLNQIFDVFNLDAAEGDKHISGLVAKRDKLRSAGNFAAADEIKRALQDEGVQIYDTAEGTRWRRTT